MRHQPKDSRSFAARSSVINNRRRTDKTSPKTPAILVSRQTGGIGDMLMITPTIRAIKESNPDMPLIVSTTDRYGGGRGVLFDILKYNPYVDKAITANELINYQFEKFYNFGTGAENSIEQNGKHPTSNRIDIFAELAGITLKDKRPIYIVKDEENELAFKWIESHVDPSRRRLIGMQMRSASSRRDWSQEKVLLLAFKIVNTWPDTSILLFYEGLFEDYTKSYPNIHNIVGLPIRHVAALINQCSLLITPDSGLMHIGGALKKKMVCLFGSIPPSARLTYYPEAVGVTSNICKPCFYQDCNQKFRCMSEITVDDVMARVQEQMGFPEEKLKGNILIVRMGGIGDLIMMTPSLRALKNKYPESKITLATRADHIDLMNNLPYIDKVISLDDRYKESYDSFLDLRFKVESPEVGGTLSSELYKTVNRIDMFSKLMGVYPLEDTKADIAVDFNEVSKIKNLLKYSKRVKWIGIQATCTSNLRTMPPEYVVQLAKQLAKFKRVKIVLFGKSESWHGRKSDVDLKAIKSQKIINLIDQFNSIKEMVALISLMDAIIAPDSSAIHVAGALNVSCLALFGNMPPILRTKYYDSVKDIYPEGELKCIPCWDFQNPCAHYVDLPIYKQPVGGMCMRQITTDRIIKSLKEMKNDICLE
jgi:heptosyltransferase-2